MVARTRLNITLHVQCSLSYSLRKTENTHNNATVLIPGNKTHILTENFP